MATVRDIITAALKMARVYSPGETPSDDDMADGLFAFQGMIDAWATQGMFGRLTDVYKTEAYEAKEWERVISTSTVTTPETVDDCGTRPPYDLALVEAVESGTRKVYLYDRTAWVQIDALTLDSNAPLALRGKRGLAACLAVEYAGDFGSEGLTPSVIRTASQFRNNIALKLGTIRPVGEAEYF